MSERVLESVSCLKVLFSLLSSFAPVLESPKSTLLSNDIF